MQVHQPQSQTQMSPIVELHDHLCPACDRPDDGPVHALLIRDHGQKRRHRRHRQRGQGQRQGLYGEVRPASPSRTWPARTRPRSRLEEIIDFLHNPEQVHRHRRQAAQGRAAGGLSRYRQDAAGQGRGRRGQRALLLHLRLGLCGDVRGRGRLPCPRPVQGGRPRWRPASSSSTRSTPSANPATAAASAATTSGSRP